jgi:hypothetical protein
MAIGIGFDHRHEACPGPGCPSQLFQIMGNGAKIDFSTGKGRMHKKPPGIQFSSVFYLQPPLFMDMVFQRGAYFMVKTVYALCVLNQSIEMPKRPSLPVFSNHPT